MNKNKKAQQNETEDYRFVREVIKRKPIDKKHILMIAVGLFLGAVFFGAVSALTFAKVVKVLQPEEKESHVSIPVVTPEPTKEPEEVEKVVVVEQPSLDPEVLQEEIALFYEKMFDAAKETEKSIVTIQGISNDVDWMNNTYENKKHAAGLFVAESESEFFVLTEYDVVEEAERILVTMADGSMADAEFQKQDSATGLAVVKIQKEQISIETQDQIQIAKLGSSQHLERGERILVLGSPAGYSDSLSTGMITSTSNVRATLDNEYHILTTDIMGNDEGSGVLVNLDGEVVGIIVQDFVNAEEQNVVTALPIGELRKVIEQLSNNEDLIYLGVRGQSISEDLSQKMELPKGIYVNSLEKDSPAMEAGIQNGDVITKVGDRSVENLSQMRRELDMCKVGQKINITAMRKGAEGYVEIVFDLTVGAL